MKKTAAEYDVEKFIKYRHSIKAATWNDSKGKWDLKVEDANGHVFDDVCDVFINAGGILK